MGYSFNVHPQPKSSFVEECISELKRDYTVISHAVRGNNLWIIVKEGEDKDPIIALYLLASQGGCWGYKSFAEVEHPYYYSCPLNFLEKVPVKNQSWRDKVKEYHARKSPNQRSVRPKVGDTVILPADKFPGFAGSYLVTKTLGRKGYEIVRNGNGVTFRLNCRQAFLVQIQEG